MTRAAMTAAAGAIGLALAGCATPSVPVATAPGVAGCTTNGLGDLIGRRGEPALGEVARQRAGAKTVRLLRPDSVMTMDYRTDRLNVMLDHANIVTGFRCG